jgi:hypothetical protein
VTLHLQGDWGWANIHRVCGWIGAEVVEHTDPRSRIAIWNGAAGKDNVLAVANGDVDVAVATPACFAAMAVAGRGPFTSEPQPGLRALGSIPQDDRMIVAAHPQLEVTSLREIRDRRLPVRVGLFPSDGKNFIAMGSRKLLATVGLSEDVVSTWGGRYVEEAAMDRLMQMLANRDVDLVIQEGLSIPAWHETARDPGLRFPTIEPDVFDELERTWGWQRRDLRPGFFAGRPRSHVSTPPSRPQSDHVPARSAPDGPDPNRPSPGRGQVLRRAC